jgi:hypothetical protein
MPKHTFRAKVWKHSGASGWFFVTLPKGLSKKIRATHALSEEGWGRLKAKAKVGSSKWDTAIWYDTRFKSYLLPLKAAIRKREDIVAGQSTRIDLQIQPNLRLIRIRQLFQTERP